MTRRRGGVRGWLKQRWTEGVLRTLERAPDRAAALERLRDSVDDAVLEGMLGLSYLAEKRDDDADRLGWADLAVEASVHGGTSRGRADALSWHARMYLNHYPKQLSERVTALRTAHHSIEAALEILAEIGPPDEVVIALSLRAQIRSALGARRDAFTDRLTAAGITLDGTDEEQFVSAARLLAEAFWRVGGENGKLAATELLAIGDRLLHRLGDRPVSAALRTALGDAHRQLGDEEAALATWATARRQYVDRDDSAGIFEVDGHLFEYAVERERYEEAVGLGERCVADAPADAAPLRLAEHHHLLGSVYRELGRVDRSVPAYERAIALVESEPSPASADSYRLELAFHRIELGDPGTALEHLEPVRRAAGPTFRWLATTVMTDLQLRRGDAAAAVRLAEAALNTLILEAHNSDQGRLGDPTLRAHCLHRCGVASYGAGDAETAYRRFAQLLPLLTEDLSTAVFEVSRTDGHAITPPSRTDSAWRAYLACRDTGRPDEAATHLARYAELAAAGEPIPLLDSDYFSDADPAELTELRPMVDMVTAMTRGITLARSDPRQALDQLQLARDLGAATAGPDVFGTQLHTFIGNCHRRLGEHDAAKVAYRAGLAASGPGTETEFGCRAGLAAVAIAERDLGSAEGHLWRCVEIQEQSRASFTGVDDRIRFLTSRLPLYEQLILVRLGLGQAAQAYAATQLVKSRTLGELLAEPEHRPIDYSLEDDLVAVRQGWDEWISTYLRPEPHHNSQRTLDMLLAEKDRRDRLKAATTTRRDRGLFDGLSGAEPVLSYQDVRAMLTPEG
ncbi:hypothetical protein ACI2K4_28555 [Micromonospora sp. NPDC050397]|uniref:hypothetical protein n=1 Tax=Micromonospora sp. NPDC050397 TaxID=3364279 RepID=UPI00384C5AB1